MVDRRVKTNDEGGIPQKMNLEFDGPLVLNFRLKLHETSELEPSDALKRRNILAVKSSAFTQSAPSVNLVDYQKNLGQFVAHLRSMGIEQVTLTRLPLH